MSSGAGGPIDTVNKQQHLYKLLVVGDYAVGKTSLIKRYCHGEFTSNYKITIGVDFCIKVINYDESNVVSLQLWDIAGHERFGPMTRVYYKFAIAAVIVFDVSRPSTLENVKKWRDDIHEKVVLPNGQPIPMLLLANKCDLPDVTVDTEKLDKFAKANGFSAWFLTSARTNQNVDEAFMTLTHRIMEISKEVNLNIQQNQPRKKGDLLIMDMLNDEAAANERNNNSARSRSSSISNNNNNNSGQNGDNNNSSGGYRSRCCT